MPAHEESGGGSRADGSLGKLTKSFVHLVQQAPNGILDLNNAAAQLDVRVIPRPQGCCLFWPSGPHAVSDLKQRLHGVLVGLHLAIVQLAGAWFSGSKLRR